MKAIYIHGLHSEINLDKIKILEEAGLEVIAPEIDYEKEQGAVYPRIKSLMIEESIDVLIGSSMGGFMAYWLARDLNKAALLYNPALHFESMKPFIPQLESNYYPPLFVCSGEKDETVPSKHLRAYLDKEHRDNSNLRIISASWLAHQIDLQTFRGMTAWFLGELAG
jgi:esterase/lipase